MAQCYYNGDIMKKIFIAVAVILVVGAGTYFYFQKSKVPPYELITVQKGDIIQEISASGKVEAPMSINLHFKNGGKLTFLPIKVGDKVMAGQIIARQDTGLLDAQLSERQAAIDAQRARLDQLQAGASQEDIAVAETAVVNAERLIVDAKQSLKNAEEDLTNVKNKADIDLSNLYGDVKNILNDAYIKAGDAVNNQTDIMFDNDTSINPRLNFISSDSQAETDSNYNRLVAGTELAKFKTTIDTLTSDSPNLDSALVNTENNLTLIESFLLRLSDAINRAMGLSQATIDTYQANVNLARTNVHTAISSINTQKQLIAAQKLTNQKNITSSEKDVDSAKNNIKTAEGNLKIAQDQLALKKAPVRTSDVALYKAQIRQAEASMRQVYAQILDMRITAPVSGIVTAVNGEVGETVSSTSAIISLISSGALQIDVNLSEDNVANVKVGQPVRITLDAFLNTEWQGTVTKIDPASTVISGNVYYKTTVAFDKPNSQVKAGMTANVWIKTGSSLNALSIPESAIQMRDTKTFVQVFQNNAVTEKTITTGLKNQNGMTEVASGLSEGEQIVIGNK